ncbi:hypothetical protein HGD90_03670 [Rhodobacteraceae bacterium R_SAG7]|nr:hypothetical protein [Rhodobacteraceae bacterium R_SAG7]
MSQLPFYFSRLKGHVDNELAFYSEYNRGRSFEDLGLYTDVACPVPEDAWPDRLRAIWASDLKETISAWGIGKAGDILVLSDELAERLMNLNLGKSELRRLPVCGETAKPLGFDVTILATLQAIPTVVARPEDGFVLNSWSTALTNYIWDDPSTPPPRDSALVCRAIKTNLDLWVDPLWSGSLFLSQRFVDAVRECGQLEKLYLHSCREATDEELAFDISATIR